MLVVLLSFLLLMVLLLALLESGELSLGSPVSLDLRSRLKREFECNANGLAMTAPECTASTPALACDPFP